MNWPRADACTIARVIVRRTLVVQYLGTVPTWKRHQVFHKLYCNFWLWHGSARAVGGGIGQKPCLGFLGFCICAKEHLLTYSWPKLADSWNWWGRELARSTTQVDGDRLVASYPAQVPRASRLKYSSALSDATHFAPASVQPNLPDRKVKSFSNRAEYCITPRHWNYNTLYSTTLRRTPKWLLLVNIMKFSTFC